MVESPQRFRALNQSISVFFLYKPTRLQVLKRTIAVAESGAFLTFPKRDTLAYPAE